MASRGGILGAGHRVWPLVRLVMAGTLAVILAMLAPTLEGFLPESWRGRRTEMAFGGLAAIYAIGRRWVGGRQAGGPLTVARRRVLWALDRLEGAAGFALAGGLSAVVVAFSLVLLALWVPHYLLWPWSRDSDTFATIAQSWEAGILPYRDIRGYNFPGAIYLFWVLGKVAGWGRTWTLYAVDAAALVLLGITLADWSRRTLGGRLPGLVAYLIFLTFYLSLDYENVAERDWHACLGVALGLLVLQAWPGRTSRLLSALLAAAAVATRPHVVVFLPALGAAIVEGAERPGTDSMGPRTVAGARWPAALAQWFLAFGLFTAIAFAPLFLAGIAGDLARGLRVVAAGGPYNRANFATARRALADEFRVPGTLLVLGLLTAILLAVPGRRRRAATWTAALIGALSYRLFHPVQHFYLIHPVGLIGSIAAALPIGWIVSGAGVAAWFRVLAALFLTYELSVGFPLFCKVPATLEALDCLAHGRTITTRPPPGCWKWFGAFRPRWYTWDDYRRVLIHLRETTGPATPVANVLKEPPFPSLNGPVGRLSPFRAESGICWMWLVKLDLEPEFVAALERDTDAVVVWSPEEQDIQSQLVLDRMAAAIRAHYHFSARFGHIEVWRRGPPRPITDMGQPPDPDPTAGRTDVDRASTNPLP
jgi:hypothetical protein